MVHIFLKGTETDSNFTKVPEGSDMHHTQTNSIFYTTAGVGREACALFGLEGGDGFDEADGADGD